MKNGVLCMEQLLGIVITIGIIFLFYKFIEGQEERETRREARREQMTKKERMKGIFTLIFGSLVFIINIGCIGIVGLGIYTDYSSKGKIEREAERLGLEGEAKEVYIEIEEKKEEEQQQREKEYEENSKRIKKQYESKIKNMSEEEYKSYIERKRLFVDKEDEEEVEEYKEFIEETTRMRNN